MIALLNFIFFVIVVATIVGAIWLSRKYKERYAEFPWWKFVIAIIIEIAAWIITVRFTYLVYRHPWLALIAIVILVIVFYKRKKKEEQIL
jgi:protein-S-isoprenylcysteine O-methyltransferase Ste14